MGRLEDIINKISLTIMRYHMTARKDRIIVALSGGPDSVCLIDALQRLSKELEISLVAAHFDHGLRGDEDLFETQLSRDIASLMDVPFETEKAPDRLRNSSSLEERAREARYEFLERIRIKHHAQKIAMGHNLNDQAETVIMRLLRGSGPSGLSGIPPVRDGRIIRPLIEITRDEITDYLKLRGLHFATDSSNNSTAHLRNRIRLDLMPILLNYQPNLLERLGILSRIIREEDALLEAMAEDWVEKETEKGAQEDVSVPVSSLCSSPTPFKNRVVREIFKRINKTSVYPMEYDHIESVIKLADNKKPQCSIDLPNGITVRKAYKDLVFSCSAPKEKTEYSYLLNVPGRYRLDAAKCFLTIDEIDGGMDYSAMVDVSTAYLDADKIQFPLIARNFKPGDKFAPMGMKGHKKVKNLFIDLKVPSEKRALTPILTSGDRIVWVCGYRIDDSFKVTAETKRVLKAVISSA